MKRKLNIYTERFSQDFEVKKEQKCPFKICARKNGEHNMLGLMSLHGLGP